MKATTVKVEGELLVQLEQTKPAGLTLTGYVRMLLQKALAREQMQAAADRYVDFIRETPDEQSWMAEWDRTDLVSAPATPAAGLLRRQ